MKTLKILLLLFLFVFASCSSVRVVTDYDKEANFDNYSSFAYYKPGIDKAQISELDKKRILRAIETELVAKGLTKTQDPDLLISIFTKERERIDVYNNYYGYGWGWNPWWYGGYYGGYVSSSTEGILYIDIIDTKSNSLIWQGIGTSKLITSSNIEKKEERIRKIVNEILAKYPPGIENK